MPDRSPLTNITQDLAGEISNARDRAEKATPIPLGQERVDNKTLRRRMMTMTKAERKELSKTMGQDAIVKLLRNG